MNTPPSPPDNPDTTPSPPVETATVEAPKRAPFPVGTAVTVALLTLLVFSLLRHVARMHESAEAVRRDIQAGLLDRVEPIPTGPASPEVVTLGSLDPDGDYRMLVTLTNRGAAVLRVELNDRQYRSAQDTSGYLGQIVAVNSRESRLDGDDPFTVPGCVVQVVGPGTQAEKAGLHVGDRIVRLRRSKMEKTYEIASFENLRDALLQTRPGERIALDIFRGLAEGAERLTLDVELTAAPLALLRPESTPVDYDGYTRMVGLNAYEPGRSNPPSFLTTFASIDGAVLPELHAGDEKDDAGDGTVGIVPKNAALDMELPGVAMRHGTWELVEHSVEHAVFRMVLDEHALEVRKTYRLGWKATSNRKCPHIHGYHLEYEVEVLNLAAKERTVALQHDGPTGLPIEGAWYTGKSGPDWQSYGLRDLVLDVRDAKPGMISGLSIPDSGVGEFRIPGEDVEFKTGPDSRHSNWRYLGIDAKYFQCTLLTGSGSNAPLQTVFPIRVGVRSRLWEQVADNTFRMVELDRHLEPAGTERDRTSVNWTIFAGPKSPEVLRQYGLDKTLSYGWFWFVVKPVLWLLHLFHSWGMGYGAAIFALALFLRLVQLPLDLKQFRGAILMEKMQPEIDAAVEKHRGDDVALYQARQAIHQRYGYSPLAGCLTYAIIIPIFLALYKALTLDVHLFGQPLVPGLSWCGNLAAPDRLLDWSALWNALGMSYFNTGNGLLLLGPYLNLLPLLMLLFFAYQFRTKKKADATPDGSAADRPASEAGRDGRAVVGLLMFTAMAYFCLALFTIPCGLFLYYLFSMLITHVEKTIYNRRYDKHNQHDEPRPGVAV